VNCGRRFSILSRPPHKLKLESVEDVESKMPIKVRLYSVAEYIEGVYVQEMPGH